MAKSRKSKNSKKVGQPAASKPRPAKPRNENGLDPAAKRYAELLRNPCYAQLVPGVGPGSGGGIVSRFISDFGTTIGTAGDTSGAVLYVPGWFQSAATPTNTNPAGVCYGSSSAGGSTFTWNSSAVQQPGGTGSSPSFKRIRPLAACLQVFYPGPESTRQGVWGVGLVNTTNVDIGFVGKPNDLLQRCNIIKRVDENMLEIKWFPNTEDGDWLNLARTTVDPTSGAEMNALLLAYSGLPGNQSLQVRLTLVAEWEPYTPGLKNPQTGITTTATLNHVLKFLQDREPQWFVGATRAIGNVGKAALALL